MVASLHTSLSSVMCQASALAVQSFRDSAEAAEDLPVLAVVAVNPIVPVPAVVVFIVIPLLLSYILLGIVVLVSVVVTCGKAHRCTESLW